MKTLRLSSTSIPLLIPFFLILFSIAVPLATPAVGEESIPAHEKGVAKGDGESADAVQEKAEKYLEELKERYTAMSKEMADLYEKHSDMPKDAYEWMKQDIKNINTWDYKVLSLSLLDSQEAEGTLNTLGADRWEVVAVVPGSGPAHTVLLKRARKSYLKTLPVKDVLRLMQQDHTE